MIERCPHCQHDVMFSRDICPECGRTAAEEERLQATSLEEEKRTGRLPTYFGPIEDELADAQKRGRVLLWLITAVLVGPDAGLVVVKLRWLSFDLFAVARVICMVLVLRALWRGKEWARKTAAGLAGLSGVALPAMSLAFRQKLNQSQHFLFWVLGVLLLTSAVTLLRSEELADYLRLRRKTATDW